MKIKRKNNKEFGIFGLNAKKVILMAIGVLCFVGGLCAVSNYILANIRIVGAVVSDEDMTEEQDALNGVLFDEDIEIYTPEHTNEELGLAPTGALPPYFNSRDTYTNVRVKNQHTEGLCWAYSITGTMEYYLAKHYNDNATEISPKALDYRLVDGQQAYKNDNALNMYYDRMVESVGSTRNFGGGVTTQALTFLLSDPFGAVSEDNFTSVIKNNDDRLESINRYEDIWDLENKNDILDESKRYTVKQDFNSLNNPDNIDYVVSGMRILNYPYYNYSAGGDRDAAIKEIKNAVVENGAARLAVTWNLSRCAYREQRGEKTVYTIINRGPNASECARADDSGNYYVVGHALVVVGWDDNWEYYDGDDLKTGAFILQNTWGTKDDAENLYYLGYNSRLYASFIDSVDKYDSSAHYYSLPEYRGQTISPESDEFVFELRTEGKERLKDFTFSEITASHKYDVYVSTSGRSEDFREMGSFSTRPGITKYSLSENLTIDGNYAIKLKRTDYTAVDDKEKYGSILRASTDDIRTLSLDANGGEEGLDAVTCSVAKGSCSVTMPSVNPTRQNYYFLGYADVASATAAIYQPGDSVLLEDDKTIYAVWAPVYTLSFDVNGGEGSVASLDCHPDVVDGSCGLEISEYDIVWDGYYFLGWGEDGAGSTPDYQPGDTITLSANKTIYAIWADGDTEWQSGNSYTIGSGENIVIRIDYPVEHFVKLLVDNVEVDNTDNSKYKVESGSTILTVYGAYLDTLNRGDHTLQALFDNDVIKEMIVTVEVDDPDVPVGPVDPVDPSEDAEDDLPVPNTAGGKDNSAPETGTSMEENEKNMVVQSFVLPMAVVIIVCGLYANRCKSKHRKFD